MPTGKRSDFVGRKRGDLSSVQGEIDAMCEVDVANPHRASRPGPAADKPVERVAEPARQQAATALTSSDTIPFNHFAAVDLRVAEILDVEEVPGAKKPLYRLRINVGELGERYLVAGIKAFYSKEELIGRRIIIVANLQPKPIAGMMSQGMLLAAENGDDVSLLQPDREMPPGCKIG